MAGKVIVVVGGQFGDEGKGAVIAHLAAKEEELIAVRVGGPNAGHTAHDKDGKRWEFRQVPISWVGNPGATLIIGQGSEVDLVVLEHEEGYIGKRVYVDRSVTVIEEAHKRHEDTIATGTTGSGVGGARADRALRRVREFGGYSYTPLMYTHLEAGGTVLVEGVQGYGLGQHAGYYPYCTSSDCRAIDFLSMAGISPWADYVGELEVWVVFKPYPTRTGGDTGPLKYETTWEALGLPDQYGVVTKKLRRVGGWDSTLAHRAVRENGGSSCNIALTMLDHAFPALRDSDKVTAAQLNGFERDMAGAKIRLVGTGPRTLVEV